MASDAKRAVELFDRALEGFRYSYPSAVFINERDVVSNMHSRLRDIIKVEEPEWSVFDNERADRKTGQKIFLDLAVMRNVDKPEEESIVLAVEFKFEPDHERNDIRKRKLPLLGFPNVAEDISRIKDVVSGRVAQAGIALLIDEGQYFYSKFKNKPHKGSHWDVWEPARRGAKPVSILRADFPS